MACIHDLGIFSTPLAGQKEPAAARTPAEQTSTARTTAEKQGGAKAQPGESHDSSGHADPVAPVLLGIALILLLAKVGGDLFERIGMPAVLGELTVGVLLGNAVLITGQVDFLFSGSDEGWHGLDFLKPESKSGAMLDILARIGVVLLLFEVGLESRIHEMLSVGKSSLYVALLGVVAPMLLGWLAGVVLIPEAGSNVHVFIGATLCATSVGITARVLKDLGRSQDRESRIILGAAVIDDVLGLIVLAVVSGVIVQGEVRFLGLTQIVGLAFGFLAGAIVLSFLNVPRGLFKAASFLRGHGLLVTTALIVCFGFSYMANVVGLAPIIGAFAAGLILEGTHYTELQTREDRTLEQALQPLTALLVPIFFVEMGIRVQLSEFTPDVFGLAVGITIMAIIGKQVCAFGAREKGLNRLAIGLGMIPRGEVGLIFAAEGIKLNVVDKGTYSAVVVMVMVTTLVTPPLLKWAMLRQPAADDEGGDVADDGHGGAAGRPPPDTGSHPYANT